MKKTMIGIAAICLLASCNQTQGWFGSNKDSTGTSLQTETAYKARWSRDVSITKENSYSDLFLDSTALENYLAKEKISGNTAERLREFYLVRNNQYAWLTSAGLTEQARALWSLYASEPDNRKEKEPAGGVKKRMDSLLANDSLFLSATDSFAKNDPSETGLAQSMAAKDSLLVQTELALSAQLVKMAGEDNGVITEENFYWLVPRKKMDAMQWADSLLNKSGDSATASANPQYATLKTALKPYYDAAKSGGWPALAGAKGLKKGAKLPAVTALKKRLAATGDYAATDTSNLFTDSLTMALMAVQEQFGQKPTGLLSDSLLAELNVPAAERVQQILVNLNRAMWMKPVTDSAHIEVNIPSLELMAYGDSGRNLRLPVIVGKEGTGTMAFSGAISTVVFSPYWNLPQSIVQREIKPAMDKDPGYLKKRNMEIVKQNDSLPEIRQLPGKDNALGRVKFLFPNSFDIYLHDTPNKDLFAQKNRALSHGCIRVAYPDSLAAYVLRGQRDWTAEKITAAMNAGKEQQVAVKNKVPVAITYYTAFADARGKLNFRHDVYGYDKKTMAKLFTGATPA